MSAARAFAATLAVLACAASPALAQVPGADPTPTGEQILARVKSVFRAHARPPFVVYTVVRRDRHDGEVDFENSYTLKVWCRTADRSALTRRVWNGRSFGDLENITVAFDERVDPGPPTADIFERALYAPKPPPGAAPAPPSPLPVIGHIAVSADYDYRVVRVRREGNAWRIALEPKRDPERNRIEELWADATTYEVQRMRVRDRLYLGLTGQSLDDEFDVRFEQRDGLPMIASIHGQTPYDTFETDYTFRDVSFPATLPDWYFQPQTYGAHRADTPQ